MRLGWMHEGAGGKVWHHTSGGQVRPKILYTIMRRAGIKTEEAKQKEERRE